jgi:hypothetical protein
VVDPAFSAVVTVTVWEFFPAKAGVERRASITAETKKRFIYPPTPHFSLILAGLGIRGVQHDPLQLNLKNS